MLFVCGHTRPHPFFLDPLLPSRSPPYYHRTSPLSPDPSPLPPPPLSSQDIPYIVAAPLLVQSVAPWASGGVGGLQSVVLYALPEVGFCRGGGGGASNLLEWPISGSMGRCPVGLTANRSNSVHALSLLLFSTPAGWRGGRRAAGRPRRLRAPALRRAHRAVRFLIYNLSSLNFELRCHVMRERARCAVRLFIYRLSSPFFLHPS